MKLLCSIAVSSVIGLIGCGQTVSGTTCPDDQVLCDGACATLATDQRNCGGCGLACAPGQTCAGGICTAICNPGQTFCQQTLTCIDTSSDNRNCGGCGNVCAPGTACTDGACQAACAPHLTLCGAQCIDTTSDLSNCGACGAACGGQCLVGECIVEMASSPDQVGISVAVDGTDVYWSDMSHIYHMTTDVMSTTTLTSFAPGCGHNSTGVRATKGIAAWTFACGGISPPSVVMTSPSLGVGLQFGDNALGLAIVTEAIPPSLGYRNVNGDVIVLAADGAGLLVASNQEASWVAHDLVTDNTQFYWSNHYAGTIVSAPVNATSAPSVIISDKNGAASLTVDAANIYWVSGAGISQASKAGGSITRLTTTLSLQTDIAVDSANVYFVDKDGVERVPIGGGARTTIVPSSVYSLDVWYRNSNGIAVDATSVYWTVDRSGSPNSNVVLYRATPK